MVTMSNNVKQSNRHGGVFCPLFISYCFKALGCDSMSTGSSSLSLYVPSLSLSFIIFIPCNNTTVNVNDNPAVHNKYMEAGSELYIPYAIYKKCSVLIQQSNW